MQRWLASRAAAEVTPLVRAIASQVRSQLVRRAGGRPLATSGAKTPVSTAAAPKPRFNLSKFPKPFLFGGGASVVVASALAYSLNSNPQGQEHAPSSLEQDKQAFENAGKFKEVWMLNK